MARKLAALVVDPNVDSRLDVLRAVEVADLEVAGESGYGTEALVMSADRQPSVVLLAFEDPPLRALATLEALQSMNPDIPVLVYASHSNPELMRKAMRAGARDFLSEPISDDQLRDAIHQVLASEEQRQLARLSGHSPATARGTIITVAGAKGGIGKTTIAANLAVTLHDLTGQEVALVDGDAQFGDVAVMLDLSPDVGIAELARNEGGGEMTGATVAPYLTRHSSGLNVLAATAGPDDWRAVSPDNMRAIATALAETHEYVIIDTPGAINDVVAASLNLANVVLLVSSLDISSIKDTRTALTIFDSWGLPPSQVRLVVNDNTHAGAVSPEDVSEAVGLELAHIIPNDPKVGLSIQTGIPIVQSDSRSKFARCITELGQTVAGISDDRVTRFPLAKLPLVGGRR